jgi:chemotaxis protein histidine kinase CheA
MATPDTPSTYEMIMSRKRPIEIFMPPNILKAKAGGGGTIDRAAVARAEKAFTALKSEFSTWMEDDVARLLSARNHLDATRTEKARDALFRASHDLKGQGTTFGYPLITRMAASLCRMIEDRAPADLPLALIDAHVNAIHIVMRDRMKDGANATATALVQELETRVDVLTA